MISPVYATPMLIHVFAYSHEYFVEFCRQFREPPFEGPGEYRYAASDVRGYRYHPWNVVKLCHFWMRDDYDNIRAYVLGSSLGVVDLHTHPVTYT